MAITTRGEKPAATDAILFANASTNISKPTTELEDSGYATQSRPGSANYNWLFNYVSAGITHEFIYGIAEYDANENYVAYSYTNRLGLIYRSRSGSNSGHTPESSPTFWHDIRTPLEFTISSGETHSPQSLFHETLVLDASLGGFTLTIDDGVFDGQQECLFVTDDSTALVYIKGTGTLTGGKKSGIWDGANTLGTPISAGLSMCMQWNALQSQWIILSTQTADYVSSGDTVKQYSGGRMQQYGQRSFSTSLVVTFPIAYKTTPVHAGTNHGSSNASLNANFQLFQPTTITLQNTAGTPIQQFWYAEGVY